MRFVLGILGGFVIGFIFPAVGLPIITEGVFNSVNFALLIIANVVWVILVNMILDALDE
jgi:hypothetical protein